MGPMLPLLALLACGPPPGHDPSGQEWPVLEPPQAHCLWVSCDVDEELWTVEVQATSWTAGGELVWTLDGDYLELHPMRSVAAEADGSGDLLRASLSLTGDWREVSPGASTAMRCSDSPDLVVALFDPETESLSDCARQDRGMDWSMVEGAPACERYVEAICRP